MGWVKKLIEQPRLAGVLAGLIASPASIYSLTRLYDPYDEMSFNGFLLACLGITSPFIAYKAGRLIAKGIQNVTHQHPTRPRTQPGDKKIVTDLEEHLQQRPPPRITFTGSQKINLDPYTFVSKYLHQDPLDTSVLAHETKNPSLGIEASLRYFFQNKYDDGLACLRDSLDWIDGKKPTLSLAARVNLATPQLALKINRSINVRHMENYFFSAALTSITCPERAWYYSALGRELADTFKLELRKESYVFHALLASAQKRTDEEAAWKDAIAVLHEQPEWERLGETRTVVRILKNTQFFAHTLVFKERESLSALLTEEHACKTLEQLVPEIAVPRPLYVTTEKYDGRYAYIMRYVPGDTLYDRLTKGETTAVAPVISALAKIHARYPSDNLPQLNLESKLKDKLADPHFRVPSGCAKSILQNYTPILSAVDDVPWVWNKDAHPENWIVGAKIGVLDCEGDHLVPATFDLANLLEYGDFFNEKEKKEYVMQYAHDMKKEGIELNTKTLMRAYYNSVIYRMLSLAGAWSAPERKRMHAHRADALKRAIMAINSLHREDSSYYSKYHEEYALLRTSLEHLKGIL